MRYVVLQTLGSLALIAASSAEALAAATPATSIPRPVPAALTTNIHASANFAGVHQHYFNSATSKMVTASGDSLYVWIYVDARNPPSEVMLQWYGNAGWTRAWWGPSDLIGWGGSQRSTSIPAAGQWVQLKVPCSALGNPGTIQGLAFTLFGGMAYWGEAGHLTNGVGAEHMWVGSSTPDGAGLFADNETWSWISYHRRGWRQQGGDSAHTNNNTAEFMIGLDNVTFLGAMSGFTNLTSVPDVQPVLLMNVTIGGVSHDVLYGDRAGATTAYDAYTGAQLWSRTTGFAPGVTANPDSAPAIDPGRNDVVYSVGRDGCLHKYAADTGQDYFGAGQGALVDLDTPPDSCRTDGWPATLSKKPTMERTRTSVTIGMFNGKRYAYLGNGPSNNDSGDYQGSATAIDLSSSAAGSQKVFNAFCSVYQSHLAAWPTTPNCGNPAAGGDATNGGGVWARGGVTFDWLSQRLFVSTGNALDNVPSPRWDPVNHYWPMSVLALNPDGTGNVAGGGFPVDNYTPSNWPSLDGGDLDLSSTNMVVLGNNGSSVPHLGAHVAKDGVIRLINLDNMSGHGGPGFAGGEVGTFLLNGGAGCPSETCKVRGPVATWINPADKTTWVYALAQNGLNAMQLTANSTTPSANGWKTPGSICPSNNCKGGVTVANGVVYFADENNLYAANPTTGAILVTLPGGTNGSATKPTPVVVNGVLYFNGRAYTVGSALPRANMPSYNIAPGNAANEQGQLGAPASGAELGNDDIIDGLYFNHSVFHTDNLASNVGGNAGGPWWKVNTPGQHTINQIVLYNRTEGLEGRLSGFRILYNTGSSWVVAKDLSGYVASAANPVVPIEVNIVNPVSIMIQKTHAGLDSDYLHLTEVRVIGN